MKRTTLLLALVVAACSNGADSDVASIEDVTGTSQANGQQGEVDAEAALLDFAQCMRDGGVDNFPDPQLDENGNLQLFGGGGGGQGGPGGLGADQGTLQAAFEECGQIIEGVVQNNFQQIDQTEFQDAFLEFAQCMRDQGIDLPDPDFGGGFGPGAGGGGGLFGGAIDPQDPAFQEAAEQCQGIFEGGFGPGGGGFGGGGFGGGPGGGQRGGN